MQNVELIIVFVTCRPDDAEKIARVLVEERFAACVNIIPVKSVYHWRDELCRDEESLLVIKSNSGIYKRLEKRIKDIHPYDVPEIVAVKTEAVEDKYLKWVLKQTGG
ncbi:MAG: divalent-cation tolerance protein CutA [Candidatus Zixiibacteriota bacterium]|nr:MAG: divalent-cation tolerance protein CutA [candidate division Zixibacteria bacterium]